MSGVSPCLTCGACCAFFRVSFHWRELQSGGGTVPDNLTSPVNQHLSCMSGTQTQQPRCVALMGDIGKQVRCTIYHDRPGPCRKFSCNGESDLFNVDCDRARAHYGLPPLNPWQPETPAIPPEISA